MLRKNILKKSNIDREELDSVEFKSNLKHTQFHDYMDRGYDEWKWFFNNLDGKEVNEEYVGGLKSKYIEIKTIVDNMLSDTVSPRIVEIDESTLPNNIDATLSRMESYYIRNKEAINELNISDDLRDELYGWNNDMYTMVVNIKKAINSSIVNSDSEDMDIELFGFGKKYQSDLNYVRMDDYLKGSMYFEATWEVIHSANGGFKNTDSTYKDMIEKIETIKDNIAVGAVKRSMREVKPDAHIVDDDKHNKIMKHIEDIYIKNKTYIANIKDNDKRKSNLARFNNDMYACLKKIRSILRNGIKELKSKDKESIDLESITNNDTGLVDLCYTPVSYADVESFTAISGLVNNGFKKLTNIVDMITGKFTVTNPDYSKLTSSFIFSKDRRYQDVYNLLVGVPKGFNGYLLDICKHLNSNITYINILDTELDGIITILSTYINSAEYRESFIIDLTKTKTLESSATNLYNENKKIITDSRDDSKPVGKLLRSANEVDAIADSLKLISKQIDMNQLDSIKFKMKQIDDLVSTMVNNKNIYSKNKLLEIARMIDATISLSNGVGTLLFIKTSVDTIILDIKELI